ncbi:MAG: hypothetical protein ACI81R_002891 [Bradymonadia bacterium]|jgi:hypothetical protein
MSGALKVDERGGWRKGDGAPLASERGVRHNVDPCL